MGVMERYNEKKKKQGESPAPSRNGVMERYELNKKYADVQTDNVNSDYINNFFTQANDFFRKEKEEESSYTSWNDLSARANTIKAWAWKNRNNLDEQTYKSLTDNLGVFDKVGQYWSQFKTPEEYSNHLKKQEEYNDYYERLEKAKSRTTEDYYNKRYQEEFNRIKNENLHDPAFPVAAHATGIVYEEMKAAEKEIEDIKRQLDNTEGGYKDSWFKGGSFDDGYDFGDTTKAILGTAGDVGLSALKGAGRMVEGIVDLATYGVGAVGKALGADEFWEEAKKTAQYSATDEWTKGATDFLDRYSVLGNKADSISEGLGQVAAIIGTGGLAGAAGLGGAGVSAVTTGVTGLSSMGTNMGEAYKYGATDSDAFWYGLGTGAVEAGTELLFGGLGKGVKALGVSRGIGGLDDIFAKKLSSKIVKSLSNEGVQRVVGNTIEAAIKSGGEGLEEVLSGYGSAVMKKLTYMSDEELSKLVEDENLLEQFVVGTIVSSIAQSPSYINANQTGTDFVTGQTLAQERAIDEISKLAIESREANGEKVTLREKNKIYDDVTDTLEKAAMDVVASRNAPESAKTEPISNVYATDDSLPTPEEKTFKTYRMNSVLGDGERSVGIVDGQAYVTNSKDILPSRANRSVFLPVNDAEVAKVEFGANESNKTSENISKLLNPEQYTPISKGNYVDGTLEGVGDVRVFTDENGREIAIEANVAEYFEGYNLEATFRGGKPYAIKATDSDGKVAGVAMAVWMDSSGQKYNITQAETSIKSPSSVSRDTGRGMSVVKQVEAKSINNEPITAEEAQQASGYGSVGSMVLAELVNNTKDKSFSQVKGDMHDAYMAGWANRDINITDTRQKEMYNAGKMDKIMQDVDAKAKAENATTYDDGLVENENFKKLSKTSQELLRMLAKDHKMSVEMKDFIIASIMRANGKQKVTFANASHADGRMEGSMSAKEKPLFVWAIHEDGHRMEQMATDEWNALSDFVYARAERRGTGATFNKMKSQHDNAGLSLSTRGYVGEVVMRELETVFRSEKELVRFLKDLDASPKAKSGFQKFMQYLSDIIKELRWMIENKKLSIEGLRAAKAELAEIEHIKELYGKAYLATRDAVNKVSTPQTSESASNSKIESKSNTSPTQNKTSLKSPLKAQKSTGINTGDVFKAKNTGTEYKILARDDKNTTVEISSEEGKKTMVISNEIADRNFANMSDDGITKWIDEDLHIDNRTWEDVSDRKVKAFQFLFPEMQKFYAPLAQELLGDLDNTVKGERIAITRDNGQYSAEMSFTGVKRLTSDAIARIKDTSNATYDDIRNALNRLINDEGQENIALAKKIELVLDEMLTDGYSTFEGQKIPPNEEYIAKKEELLGKTYDAEASDNYDGWDDLMGSWSNDGVSFALSEDADAEVTKVLNNKNYKGEVKLTDSSPSIILNHKGVRNLPMTMIASHIRENIFTEAEAKAKGLPVNKGINYHGLGKPLFLEVIAGLDNVTEAYRGTPRAKDPARREKYFLLITQHTDGEGNIINVPVYINEKGLYNRAFIDTNKIATVFGKEGLRDYISRQLKEGNLVRIKKRSTKTSESTSPIDADYGNDTSLNGRISQSLNSVKKNFVEQKITSAKTSIKQIPALFKDKNVVFGKTNIDIGGGKYDLATEYLKEQGTKNYLFDPYNRSKETNTQTLNFLLNGNKADTATCANVLNVIAESKARENVILEMAKAVKDDGKAYFMVYEGDGSGKGRETSSGWQNNRKTADYVREISKYFDSVERKGKLIIATNPKSNLPKAYWEVTQGEGISYSLIDDEINQSMTMEQAKDMIQRAFVIGGIKEWFDGEYKNGDEWLKGEGADAVALVVENEWQLQQKFLDKVQGGLNEDFFVADIIEAYENGTLTGKVKQNVVKRLNTSRATNAKDTRVFAPKEIENAQEIYKVASERVTNSNREKVYQARADIIMFAHTRGAAEALGLTQSELNKKLATWARYTARAREVSMRFNKDVAIFNKWTGIENSNVLNRATVSQEELDNLVNEVKGDSNGWQRSYIMRTMLALDTHIDYSELNFEFVGTPKTTMGKSVNGLYDNKNRKITVKYNAPHTVSHEMGHFLDYQWARDFGINSSALTDGFGRDKQTDADVKQFLTNFDEFIEQIENSADLRSEYTMDRKEVFARFVAKFVQWVDLVANGKRSYAQEYLSYNDKFTSAQYVEFVRLLQEKSMIDSKKFGNTSYSLMDNEPNSIEDIKTKYADQTDHLYINEKKNTISIDNMVVKKENRNQGIGTKILNDIISYADRVQKTITLTPTSEFGTKEKLKKWYKANGFVENKGRNTDFTISDTMYRLPAGVSYSLKEGKLSKAEKEFLNTVEDMENGKKGSSERLAKYVKDGTISTKIYQDLIEQYGAIPKGENPYRDVSVPQKTAKNKKVSQTVRTILEAEATPDEAVPTIEKMVEDGIFSYEAYSDKQAINDAESYIKEYGWDESLDDWFDAVNKGEVSKDLTAMGWALYNNAANLDATTTSETERTTAIKTSLKILDAMVRHQRSAAQALQATRILKKLSPETQLYGIQKSVQAFQNELTEKYGEKAPDLKIDEALAEQFMNAKTEEERAEAEKAIYKDIGRQMPSRFIDKWNAWRYLAMLGNPRTHIRNIGGNAFFAPVVATKNLTATAIESVVHRVSRKKMVRGKALITGNKADRALLKAAWADYDIVADKISNGGKYNDSALANQSIEDGRQIFKFKPLEWARKGNSIALEAEDMWFAKPHYAFALAQYCKANNITAEQIKNGKAIAPARDYAIKEAQKATYRDTNAFSQMVSEWGRAKTKNKWKKATALALEGILPFRKTPANILVRGIEYSPIGLLKSLTYDLRQVSKGKMMATEAIDNISAGLTGTGLLALGVYLAAQGLVRGHGEDEKEEKEFSELMGHQAYSLELPNGQSITLDWLAPEALPFFVGVNIWETTSGTNEELNLSSILKAVTGISEPMLEMSCLQSLNDIFESIGYASSNDMSGLASAASSAATSYLTQAFPTLLGQAERTGEEERMTTYTEKNDFLTGDMQYTLGKVSAKIPFWDYHQIPYIDAWGRREASGTALKRGLNNFLNPAYTSTIEESAMEKELLRLYESTGETKVFPSRADKYFTVDKARKDLTADEYVRYATLKGEKSYKLVSDLVNSKAYKKLDDGEKVKAISEAYDYANQKAKQAVSNYKGDSWVATADEFGKGVGNYLAFRADYNDTKSDNGGKIEKTEVIDIIMDMAQNDNEMWLMYLDKYDSENAQNVRDKGIEGETYLNFLDALDEVDEPTKSGKYGSYTQDEAKKAVNRVDGLTRKEKSILWQSVNSSWKNNPF